MCVDEVQRSNGGSDGEVAPEIYRQHVTMEGGQKVSHVEPLKALCGLSKSALKFCLKVVKDLKELGFKLNPCDGCVANKTVNGKQQTVIWHADDMKISHVDKKVNGDSMKEMKKEKIPYQTILRRILKHYMNWNQQITSDMIAQLRKRKTLNFILTAINV